MPPRIHEVTIMSTTPHDPSVSRRSFLVAGSTAALAGTALASCASTTTSTSSMRSDPIIVDMNGRTSGSQFILQPLPWKENALEPVVSANTISFHYGKHHKAYVDNLNKLIAEKPRYEKMTLVDIVKASAKESDDTAVFNNAAQAWNHTFYWNSLKPGAAAPTGALLEKINTDFGNVDACKAQLAEAAKGQFGSGWAWLVTDGSKLSVIKTANANTPITEGKKPLLVIDVWEHAYYLDRQERRAEYVNAVVDNLLDWDFAAANLERSEERRTGT
jgi:Fe-Mn family superoxide dismutase